ncbi:MAG: hypothetical protein M3371_15915 [Acidobacteriota bacterium]|nr:hypothetical protein [Acidobacteriota bacterium]
MRLEVINNQPFPIKMPLGLRGVPSPRDEVRQAQMAVQREGDDLIFIADLAASSRARVDLQRLSPRSSATSLALRPIGDTGIALTYGGRELGQLGWDIIVRDVKDKRQAGRSEAESTRDDFAHGFQAMPMRFQSLATGALFDTWNAQTEKSGLRLLVELRAYHAGFLDINVLAENVSAPTTNVYAAIVCRWQQPQIASRSLNYNNEVLTFGSDSITPFRGTDASGTGDMRHLFIQRGVDWINNKFDGGTGALWVNDFAPSFTVHQDATAKRPARWTGANSPQLAREALAVESNLYAVTELAHDNTRYYLERFVPNVLPPAGEPLRFAARVVLSRAPLTDARADEEFIAYTGYATQSYNRDGSDGGAARIEIGVPGVRFGTNYFPYSTLGENFTTLKLPGMDRAAYWPLAADTVKQWRLFADDIRRDLRIAKAMGFDLIRLHHLELISSLDEKIKTGYLDFFFSELRELQLKALLDAQMKPEEIAALVSRYRDALSGVEIENEVLIFGINDGRVEYWNAVYDAVKKIDPEMPVHLTGHTNAGAFDRLARLGGKFDRIGQHAYMDSLKAIPSSRGFALAAANYGRKVGKPSIITEWNWRGLSRLTPEERAKVYPPIFENVLKTRSVPEIYQFQFNESLAMDPLTLKGIRHYEPIWLSRRPKPEALELMRLIRQYSLPSNPVRLIDVERRVTELDAAGRGTINFRITNRSIRTLSLRPSLDVPVNLTARFVKEQKQIRLAPNASASVSVSLAAQATQGSTSTKPLPGFYHVFLRLEGDDDLLRYGWAEARLAGAPQIDMAPNAVSNSNVRYDADALSFNFNRPLAVVYGDGSPILDLETASALTNTLESATGRPVAMYHLPDLPADFKRSGALILVGTMKTNALVSDAMKVLPQETTSAQRFVARLAPNAQHGERLVISGATPEDAERAAMDLLIRYWKHAKDSAARRIGLVAKEIRQGGDPALLP